VWQRLSPAEATRIAALRAKGLLKPDAPISTMPPESVLALKKFLKTEFFLVGFKVQHASESKAWKTYFWRQMVYYYTSLLLPFSPQIQELFLYLLAAAKKCVVLPSLSIILW